MSLLTIPNVLVNGTGPASIVDAVGLNANFTAIATAVNNIYPSQILPITTGQATFGATATGVGYTFRANDATAVPLTVSGVSGQTADIFDVTLTSGGTKALFVAANGDFTVQASSGSRQLVVNSNGLISINTYASNVSITAPSVPSSLSSGDIVAQRTTTTGRYYLGGISTFGLMDFNDLNSNGVSFQNNSGYAPVFGGAYTNSSDAALKTNIAPISGSLAKISALTPVTFDWLADGKPGIGFTAQDVQAQFPDAVTADVNGVLGYAPVAVLAHLVQAFQEYVAAHP